LKPRDIVNVLVYTYAVAVTVFCASMSLRESADLAHTVSVYANEYVEPGGVFTIQHDSKWRRVRNQFYATHQTCAMCGAAKDVQVHHILPWHLYPDLRYTHTNLISLCQPCHFRFGHGRDWKAYNPDIGNLSEAARESLKKVVTRQQHEEGLNE